jgi:hypothetical protein
MYCKLRGFKLWLVMFFVVASGEEAAVQYISIFLKQCYPRLPSEGVR